LKFEMRSFVRGKNNDHGNRERNQADTEKDQNLFAHELIARL